MSRYRKKISRSRSKKLFRKGTKIHPRNASRTRMRGGIRL